MPSTSPTSLDVARRLRERIVAGDLRPGAALRQESLAAEMGVSRLPIRDAIWQLEAEGLVEAGANRGAFVATLTASQCAEVFDLRALLECEAIAAAIPHHSPRSLRQLEAVQAELEAEDEVRTWAQGDRRFHELLYAPAGRPWTLRFIGTLRNVVERFYVARLDPDVRREGWRREHRQVLRAVKARDVAAARQHLARHLRRTEDAVLAAIGTISPEPRKVR